MPITPTITLNPFTSDNIINATEASGSVTVSGTTTDVADGSSAQIHIDGLGYLRPTVSANSFSISLSPSVFTGLADGRVDIFYNVLDSFNGWSSTTNGSFVVDRSSPSFQSATVNGTNLVLSFNEPLDAVHAANTSDFAVLVDGSPVQVSNIAVTNNQISLTLQNPVTHSQVVSVDYTAANSDAISAIQDVAGNDAATILNVNVTNSTPLPDTTPPTFVSAEANGNTMVITYSETLDPNSIPSAAAFYIPSGRNMNVLTVDTVQIAGNKVTLTLHDALVPGQTLGIAYSAGSTRVPLQDLAGNDVAPMSTSSVDNITGGTQSPPTSGGGGNPPIAPDHSDLANNLLGTSGPDTIVAGLNNDSVAGGAGDDQIFGNQGDDFLSGNQGADTISGGQDNDSIYAGQGNDLVGGDRGSDRVFGDLGNDTVSGGEGNDTVYGGQGATARGVVDGNDVINGNQGNDLVNGNAGDDTVSGGQGDDSVFGGQGNDVVFGDLGNDRLSGDRGNDVLTGGAGSDVFVFAPGSGNDIITDFHFSEGDRLDLGGQTYNLTTASDGSAALILQGGDVIILQGVTQAEFSAAYVA